MIEHNFSCVLLFNYIPHYHTSISGQSVYSNLYCYIIDQILATKFTLVSYEESFDRNMVGMNSHPEEK